MQGAHGHMWARLPCSAIFFETKLKHHLGRDMVWQAIQHSLQESGLEYVQVM